MSNINNGDPPVQHSKILTPGGLSPSSSDEATSMKPVFIAVAVVGLLGSLAALYWVGRGAAISVAYGATLASINLAFLGRMVRAFLSQQGASAPWILGAFVKLAVLLLAMYLPVREGILELLPFMCGFGALPVGIVCGQLFSAPSSSKVN
jgi:hypothetical protein